MLELRYLVPRFTLEMLEQGLSPARIQTEQGIRLYGPPTLQWRLKQRVMVNGQPTSEWTPWQTVSWVREGDDPQAGDDVSRLAGLQPSNAENPTAQTEG